MAGIKIVDLPNSTLPYTGTERIPITQDGQTRNGTLNSLANYISAFTPPEPPLTQNQVETAITNNSTFLTNIGAVSGNGTGVNPLSFNEALGSVSNNTIQFFDDFSQYDEGRWVKNGDNPLSGNPLRFNFATKHQVTAYAVTSATSPGNSAVTAGTVTVTITGTNITGSPLTIPVNVSNGDDSVAVANKIKTAFNANTAITSNYIVGGTSGDVPLSAVSWNGYPNVITTSTAHGLLPGDTFRFKNFAATAAQPQAAIDATAIYNNNWFTVRTVTNSTTLTIDTTRSHGAVTVTGGSIGKASVSLSAKETPNVQFDHTLNISITNGTSTGILTKSESYHTQGAAPIIVSDLQTISVAASGTSLTNADAILTVTGRYVAGGTVTIPFAVASGTLAWNSSIASGWVQSAVAAFNNHPAVNQTYVATNSFNTIIISAKSLVYRPFFDPSLTISISPGATTGTIGGGAKNVISGGGRKYLMGSNNCLFYMSSFVNTMAAPRKFAMTLEMELLPSSNGLNTQFDRGPNISFMEAEMIPVGGGNINGGVNGDMVHMNLGRGGINSLDFYNNSGSTVFDEYLTGPSGQLLWGELFSKIKHGNKFFLTVEGDDQEVRYSAFGTTLIARHPLMATKLGQPQTHFWFEGGGDGTGADLSLWKLHKWWVNSPVLDYRQRVSEGGAAGLMGDGIQTPGQLHLRGSTEIKTPNTGPFTFIAGGVTVDQVTGHVTGGESVIEGRLRLGSPVGSTITGLPLGVAPIAGDDTFTTPLQSTANALSSASFLSLLRTTSLPTGMCERATYIGTFGANTNSKRIMIIEASEVLFDTGALNQNGGMWKLIIHRVSHASASERWVFEFWSTDTGTRMIPALRNRGSQFTSFTMNVVGTAVGDVTVVWRLGEVFSV
jgi:hypothetical protein